MKVGCELDRLLLTCLTVTVTGFQYRKPDKKLTLRLMKE